MMTRMLLGISAALLVCLSTGSVEADSDWWGDLDKGEVVKLSDVMAKPMDYRGRQITFTCISSGKANVYFQESAILSRQRYTNYAVWPDGTVVWRKRDFVTKDFPFLFIGKEHFQHDALLGLRKFTRIEVTGKIKAILRNKPHIEVTSWRETSHRLGRAVYDAMVKGDAYMDGGELDLAIERYKQALRPDLPTTYRLLVRKQLAAALRQAGRGGEAAEVDNGGIVTREDFGKSAPDTNTASGSPDGFPPPAGGADDQPPTGRGAKDPFDDMPGTPVFPNEVPPSGTQPRTNPLPSTPPAARGERANPFLDDDLPGMGATAPSAPPPTAPVQPRPGTTPRRDLPPAGPAPTNPGFPGANDLPGQPVNPPPAQPVPNPLPPTGAVPPSTPTKPRAVPAPRSGAPVRPPKRRPRLAGVK